MNKNGCRCNSWSSKDQLIIDKTILNDCKQKPKKLAMAWVDNLKV